MKDRPHSDQRGLRPVLYALGAGILVCIGGWLLIGRPWELDAMEALERERELTDEFGALANQFREVASIRPGCDQVRMAGIVLDRYDSIRREHVWLRARAPSDLADLMERDFGDMDVVIEEARKVHDLYSPACRQ